MKNLRFNINCEFVVLNVKNNKFPGFIPENLLIIKSIMN